MNTIEQLREIFYKNKLSLGRMVSAHKSAPKGHFVVWNANAITKSLGKFWWGDIDITESGQLLKDIANQIGEEIYILRESDCRFETEEDPIDLLITKAAWSTNREIA